MNIRPGYIAGSPIRWFMGPGPHPDVSKLVVVTNVGMRYYMHNRLVPLPADEPVHDLTRARVKKIIREAEAELRCRVYRKGAQNG